MERKKEIGKESEERKGRNKKKYEEIKKSDKNR